MTIRATTPRLGVLRQILHELVAGLEQFLLVDDVVAVEDGAGLVAGQEHGDALGDAGADQVVGGGAPAIVEEAGRYAGRLTGGAPRRAPAADGDAVAVEDQRAVGVAARPPSREGLGNGVRDRENPPHQRLRAGGREPNDAAGLVKFVPGEAEDLVLAPAGVVGQVEDVLPRGGQVGADGKVLGVFEEALAGGILPQAVGEAGHGVEPAPVDGEGAHAVEGRGLAIDGAGGRLMTAADWDLSFANPRPDRPRPTRDVEVTHGQKVTLGDTTVTLAVTPGHTAWFAGVLHSSDTQRHVRHRVAAERRAADADARGSGWS